MEAIRHSLNLEAFRQTKRVLGIKLPLKMIKDAMANFKNDLVTIPKFSNVIEIGNDKDRKMVLLEDDALTKENVLKFVEENKVEYENTDIELGFDNFNSTDALKILLPKDV